MQVLNRSKGKWVQRYPLLKDIIAYKEIIWNNPERLSAIEALSLITYSREDIEEASARLDRFRPLIRKLFPETIVTDGIIESELKCISNMARAVNYTGNLLIKLDSDLPIAGSVKARGGIYEILKLAETIAIREADFSIEYDYAELTFSKYRQAFGRWEVVVGSTGNLGLSIGMISSKLGFKVTVHMSADAKQWKKDMLRANGVQVMEHESDYSNAVEEGRKQALANPNAHFVDDENSLELFMGYSVAALRLSDQLERLGCVPTLEEPLDIYLPCGVGGAPCGITFGIKHVFGDAVRCWIVEPTHSPCMLIGLMTGEHDRVSVQDFGLDNRTDADGLAVGRASKFAGKMIQHLVSGVLTVSDQRLNPWTRQLFETEGLFIEPSAAASIIGPVVQRENKTSIVWATGGSLVPTSVREKLFGAKL